MKNCFISETHTTLLINYILMICFLIGAATVENSVEVPQNIKNRTAMSQQFHFWVFIQRK